MSDSEHLLRSPENARRLHSSIAQFSSGLKGLLWWHFTCPDMDYDASPDWYAGAV